MCQLYLNKAGGTTIIFSYGYSMEPVPLILHCPAVSSLSYIKGPGECASVSEFSSVSLAYYFVSTIPSSLLQLDNKTW